MLVKDRHGGLTTPACAGAGSSSNKLIPHPHKTAWVGVDLACCAVLFCDLLSLTDES